MAEYYGGPCSAISAEKILMPRKVVRRQAEAGIIWYAAKNVFTNSARQNTIGAARCTGVTRDGVNQWYRFSLTAFCLHEFVEEFLNRLWPANQGL